MQHGVEGPYKCGWWVTGAGKGDMPTSTAVVRLTRVMLVLVEYRERPHTAFTDWPKGSTKAACTVRTINSTRKRAFLR